MERVAFADLLFKIEELLIDVDYWRRQISDCNQCQGWAEEDYRNLCPSCMKALNEEFEALKKVSSSAAMREALKVLKGALEGDATGELAEIFRLARRTTVN